MNQGLLQHCYIYLHGFASGPNSTKARDLYDRFAQLGIELHIPDLNQNDFTHLTLTRQLQQVAAMLPTTAPVTLIGSSFGGLTAAWLGQQHVQVERLVLLAPAFGFPANWLTRLGTAEMLRWQRDRVLPVFHYAENRTLPLDYGFVEDALRYEESEICRSLPTLILHGTRDDVIPIQASRDFSRDRSWVTLIELDSDHALVDVSTEIWQATQRFCQTIANR